MPQAFIIPDCQTQRIKRNRKKLKYYTVSQKNCANLFFAPSMSNIYQFQ